MKSRSTRWVCPSAMLSASASLTADVGAVALTSTGASIILAGVTSPVAWSTTSMADTAGQRGSDRNPPQAGRVRPVADSSTG